MSSSNQAIDALERRLGRPLSSTDIIQLAALAYAVRLRRAQQLKMYKPRMELVDDGESPRISAVFEVPGLRPESISVDVVDGRLVVSGDRRQHSAREGAVAHTQTALAVTPVSSSIQSGVPQISELKYGLFRRVLDLPSGCTTADLRTTMENGMLTVSWPRHPLDAPLCKSEPESSPDLSNLATTSTARRFGDGRSSRAM